MKAGHKRFYFVFLLFFFLAGAILLRFFSLQIKQHGFFEALADKQQDLSKELAPRRGEIYIQERNNLWHPLAVSRDFKTAYLVPKEVVDAAAVAEQLAPLIGSPPEKISEKLADKDDPYEPLKSKLDDETAEKISNLNLDGVHLQDENWRWYPQGVLASHVLGFVGLKNEEKTGQYGLEQYYEKELAGQSGFLKSQKDALGHWLLMGDYDLESAKDGDILYLTLDQNIQYIVEQKMKELTEKWNAAGGCAIVMDPKTGAVKAMVSLPNFDPNNYKDVSSIGTFLNSCTQEVYEPGSVFKPIVVAAGLDTGKISPQTIYVDEGSVQIGGYTIQNSQKKIYGLSTMTNVLEKSINTGVIFIQRLIGGDVFRQYIEAFGFGELTGIDLTGEAGGNLDNVRKEKREINFATATFGQGISATPLQMISAMAAIANDGKLMKPYLVEKIVSPDGQEKITEPEVVRQAISTKSASQLTAMLVSTVRNGYDKIIKIKNYFIAGKTGTAQIPNEDSLGYSADETNHTFVGYAPAYNPQFIILLKIEKPHGIEFASESLAPVFGELAQYLFNYYEIPPEE
jgi:cell division protein FtsI/penicillin-binding protein 2